MKGYQNFALFYDLLQKETENGIDYTLLSAYIDKLFKNYNKNDGILLDLACGTGELSIPLSKLSYDVIGVDNSTDMLNIAMNKSHGNIQYLCQDMRNIDMFGTIDYCVSALDSINHIVKSEEVYKVFEKVSLFMNKGGLFYFDVNTLYKHSKVLSYNTFVYDLSKVYCVWENCYLGNGLINIYLDFFAKTDNENYIRYSDTFSEKAYSLQSIESMLCKAGFQLLEKLDWLTFNEGTEKNEKVAFLARKK